MNVREAILSLSTAVLSTQSHRYDGYPFGSVIPYDVDENGHFIIYISLIAEHFKNLAKEPRACLTISDPFAFSDVQSTYRITALTTFIELTGEEENRARVRYEKRFPGSVINELAHNFRFYRGIPSAFRWIGGIGSMGWISGDDYRVLPFDEICYHSPSIVQHMNDDHRDTFPLLAKAYCDLPLSETELKKALFLMTGITATEMNLRLFLGGAAKELSIQFPQRVESPVEARKVLVALVRDARLASDMLN